MKKIKQSETKTIWRSQINLNPINPKRHNDAQVETQKKNLKKVGFLGGVVWNELSENLIDGHRRIKALDIINKYDGSAETDYEVKVEAVEMDEKTEKEQLTYMAVGNTKPDLDLIANYIGDIDYSDIGLSERDIEDILSFNDTANVEMMTLDDLFEPKKQKKAEFIEEYEDADDYDENIADEDEESEGEEESQEDYEARKAHMKQVKAQVRQKAMEESLEEEAYITLSFSSFDAKQDFCEMLGINAFATMAKGEEVMNLIG